MQRGFTTLWGHDCLCEAGVKRLFRFAGKVFSNLMQDMVTAAGESDVQGQRSFRSFVKLKSCCLTEPRRIHCNSHGPHRFLRLPAGPPTLPAISIRDCPDDISMQSEHHLKSGPCTETDQV